MPGHGDDYSAMDYFARLGYDVWCFDCEGYGRSDKTRDTDFYVADGADDAEAVADYIRSRCAAMTCSCWSTASRPAPCAPRCWPNATRAGQAPGARRLRLDRRGLAHPRERAARTCRILTKTKRRPIDLDFVRSIFTRDHPGTADDEVIEAFASAIFELDDSTP